MLQRLIVWMFGAMWLLGGCTQPPPQAPQNSAGSTLRFTSSHAMFPHPDRWEGHHYGEEFFEGDTHYADSSVLIYIPPQFQADSLVNMLFYFHGWGNSIDESMEKFRLAQQLEASGRNLILVFPEGPKQAKDSFGGKLEAPGTFEKLVADVMIQLQSQLHLEPTRPGNIVLAGHSGAYRVMGHILRHGGLSDHIREVYLFDALYAQEGDYIQWLQSQGGRLITIVTPRGGTLDNSQGLMRDLDSLGISTKLIEGNEVSDTQLKQAPVVMLSTSLAHNQVVDPFLAQCLRTGGMP